MPQYVVTGKVHHLRHDGKDYFPGQVVELSEKDAGRLNGRVEPAKPLAPETAPAAAEPPAPKKGKR